MKIQAELIEKYILLLMEYIHLVNSSEIIPQLENTTSVFQIGVNALAHIYKITFLITKNVESAGCYTQKGIYCYLEYIEQMNRTNSLHNLDNMDAILFVYDKTLTDVYAPNGITTNSSHQQNMFSNILSMNHPHTEDSHWKMMLENLCSFTKTILWIDRKDITYLQRIDLAHEHLQKWLILAFDNTNIRESTLEIMKYIPVIQEKCPMTYPEYILLLETMFKSYKKAMKQSKIPDESVVREKCMVVIVYFSGKTFSEMVDSDYGKSEGWKTIVDVIKWMFV
jgi:hypothetical protein